MSQRVPLNLFNNRVRVTGIIYMGKNGPEANIKIGVNNAIKKHAPTIRIIFDFILCSTCLNKYKFILTQKLNKNLFQIKIKFTGW